MLALKIINQTELNRKLWLPNVMVTETLNQFRARIPSNLTIGEPIKSDEWVTEPNFAHP